jgi:hypothetical protein
VYNCGVVERCLGNQPQEFVNEYCRFKPSDWQEIDGILRPLLFKVVTEDLKSLGLRRNPNIMKFPVGEWVRLPDGETQTGNSDWGGIWSALKLSGAKTLTKYILEKYNLPTRTFQVALDTPLYANSYRVKSWGVILLRELDLDFSQKKS